MNEPTLLMRVPTEPEAMLVQNDLAGEGIESSLEGVLTSAFRTEAPGMVSIWVDEADIERAWEIAGAHVPDEPVDGEPAKAKWTRTRVVAVSALILGLASLLFAIISAMS